MALIRFSLQSQLLNFKIIQMKKISLVLLLILTSVGAFAQIRYEKGYVIRENESTNDVFIKNEGWKNNPSEISAKTSEESEPFVLKITEIREFGINGEIKYVRATVPVGRIGNKIEDLDKTSDFKTEDETVLLKVLAEGDANLYQLQMNGEKLYFFSINGSEIEPLIYKKYLPLRSIKIHENNHFRQQLYNQLQCAAIDADKFQNLRYTENDFIKIFEKYNKCKNENYTGLTARNNEPNFHLSIRPGVRFDQLKMETFTTNREMEFDQKASLVAGLQAEFVLPFQKNKWSILAETYYHSYSGEAVFPSGNANLPDGSLEVDYKAIALGLGVRHSFFLTSNSKLFLNASVSADFSLGSEMNFETVYDTYSDFDFEKVEPVFVLGGGYSFKKWSFEGRFDFPHPLADKELSTEFSGFSFLIGYQIF